MKEYRGFRNCGSWYKGNIHSRTAVSGRTLTSEQSVTLYRDNGYHSMCFSEYDIFTDFREQLNTETFIILPAVGSSVILYRIKDTNERYKVHHLHGTLGTQIMQDAALLGAYGHMQYIPPMKFFGEWIGARAIQETADMLRGHGYVTTYNHPIWSRVTGEESIHTGDIGALEIFNYNTVQESNIGYDVTYWSRALRMGRRVNAFVGDDNYNEGLFKDSYGDRIYVQAPDLNHDSVMQNFMGGNYYSSSRFETYNWGVKDGKVWIDTSGVNHINFVCRDIINGRTTALGERFRDTLDCGEYTLKGHETYIRTEAVDKYGRTAWTSPIYLE